MNTSDKKEAGSDSTTQGLNDLRVKVAELCGWEQVVQASMDCWEGLPPVGHAYGRASGHWQIPDYPNDLNACAELIDSLADKGWNCSLGNGLDKTWECEFYKTATNSTRAEDKGTIYGLHDEQEIHYESADKLSVAICGAFMATMEADSVHGSAKSETASSSSQ